MFAEVVFNLPLANPFTYSVPESMSAQLKRGMRVMAPFGRRRLVGMVVGLLDSSKVPKIKPIQRIIDPFPLMNDFSWELAAWISRNCACSFGEAVSGLIPSQLRIKASDAVSGDIHAEHLDFGGRSFELTREQTQSLERIYTQLEKKAHQTFLLFGVTGSGKTELYLSTIQKCLDMGRTAICLIPEISLTPQSVDRFRERFGDTVAIWHSRLTAKQRAQVWQGILNGEKRIVIGARSAVFAPLKNLGAIIIDEEHEQAYKQEDVPRYHARDVAEFRAQQEKAVLILGSATPSVESFFRAQNGRYELLRLPDRVGGASLSQVDVIDMRVQSGNHRSAAAFSPPLRMAIEQAVQNKQQVILLLNRRGFSRVAQCRSCGFVVFCKNCAIPLIYHATDQVLLCHYCNFQIPPAENCPECGKGELKFRGTGTERIESELHRFYPESAIARMDSDTTKHKDAHQDLYEGLRDHQIGLLVGTQMIAKGHHFPQVTVVGVISADTSLNLPDFRAGERTFDLLTQVAGRAGRGEHPGRVLIQTYNPDHYAIECAANQDYEAFYGHELETRKQFGLPPFAHLIELLLRGKQKPKVYEAADKVAKAIRDRSAEKSIQILGPAPHRLPKLMGMHRVSIILKSEDKELLLEAVAPLLECGRKIEGIQVAVDVDPL